MQRRLPACRAIRHTIVWLTYQAKDSIIALKDTKGRSAVG